MKLRWKLAKWLSSVRRLFLAGLCLALAGGGWAQTAMVGFSATAYSVGEDRGVATLQVLRGGDTNSIVTVELATSDLTAVAGADYVAQSGLLLSFAPGQTNQLVFIPILDDGLVEGDETLQLILSNPVGALLGVQSNATLTIVDNETPTVLDGTFHPGTGANNDVFAVALQPDGKIIVGGQFTTFNSTNRSRIARLNTDGSLDLSFDPGSGADGDIYAVAVQADGKVLMGGAFTSVNGRASQYVARLNSDGTFDDSFAATNTVNNELRALAVQPDGKILVAGRFTSVAGQSRNRVARLMEDGTLDTLFNPGTGANNNVRCLTLQPDGLVLIGGQFTNYNGVARGRIARLNTNGALDSIFDPGLGANDQVRAIAVATNGLIYIGGDFEIYNGTNRSAIARLFPNGALDLDFDQGDPDNDTVRAISVDAEGKVWIGGQFAEAGHASRNNLTRLDLDGAADTFFALGTAADDEVFAIVIQPNCGVLIGGKFNSVDNVASKRVARLNTRASAPQVRLASAGYAVSEDGGAAFVTILRDGDTSGSMAVDYATRDGTAVANSNYEPGAGTVAFAPFETAKIVAIPLLNDGLVEGSESFELRLSNPAGAVLAAPTSAIITILDNDRGFEFSAATFQTSESEGSATITVLRQDDGGGTATVAYATSDGTAQAGADYTAQSGTLVFGPGETNKSFTVPILTDTTLEDTETVLLVLNNPSPGASLGSQRTATLAINDQDSTISLYAQAAEPDGYATVFVTREGVKHQTATVDYATSDGTATAGLDYVPTQGTITFGPGEGYKHFVVAILNDGLVEGPESIILTLSNPTGGAVLGPGATNTLWIQDNDIGLEFTTTNLFVSENSTTVTLTVRRGDDGQEPLSCDFNTSDGTALAGINYLATAGRLNFGPDDTTRTITIPVLDACMADPDKTMLVRLSNPSARAAIGPNDTVVLHIQSNDHPGSFDRSMDRGAFSSTYEGRAWALAVQPDGKILAATDFYTIDNDTRSGVLRFNVDGSFDPAFQSPPGSAHALALQADGKVLADFYEHIGEGIVVTRFVRLNRDGTQDGSFLPPALHGWSMFLSSSIDFATSVIAVQPDGRILVGGRFSVEQGISRSNVARLNVDGSLDPTFEARVDGKVLVLGLQSDGKIIIGGLFQNVADVPRSGIARLNADGSLDTSFDPGSGLSGFSPWIYPPLSALVPRHDGGVVLAGTFTSVDGALRDGIARLNADGSVDSGFVPSPGPPYAVALAEQADGKLLVGGGFTTFNGQPRNALVRLNQDGSLDLDFEVPPEIPTADVLALQSDGRILSSTVGTFTFPSGVYRLNGNRPARFLSAARQQNGHVQLQMLGQLNQSYILQSSTNLTDWLPVATNTASGCTMRFDDVSAPFFPRRFYRAVQAGP